MTELEPTMEAEDREPEGETSPTRNDLTFRVFAASFLPVLVGQVVWLSSRHYFDPLFGRTVLLAGQPLGWWLFAGVLLLSVAGGVSVWRARSNVGIGVSMVVFTMPAVILLLWSPAIVSNLQPEQSWVTYAAPDASFSVAFPGEPYEKISTVGGPDGLPTSGHEVGWVASDRSHGYWLNYIDYPAGSMSGVNAKEAYDSTQSKAIAAGAAALIDTEDIVLDRYPGREYTALAEGVTVTVRMYLVGDRLYKLDTNSPHPDASEIAAFFDSFQLTGD
jgi:hypothetical protein